MTDEEFLKLARECGATRVAYPDPQCWVGSVAFGDVDFLTLCREIERRALERAAEKCEAFDFNERIDVPAPKTIPKYCAASIRAMTNEIG